MGNHTSGWMPSNLSVYYNLFTVVMIPMCTIYFRSMTPTFLNLINRCLYQGVKNDGNINDVNLIV